MRRGSDDADAVDTLVDEFAGNDIRTAMDELDMATALAGQSIPSTGDNHHSLSHGIDLPSDVNIEEAKMLEAALLGVPYEGRIPGRDELP